MNNILIPRRIEGRSERWKIITQRRIQEYIKNGSVGDLNLKDATIEKLPDNLIEVNGYLYLNDSKIQDLGNLKAVKHSLWLQNTPIESLGNLESVGYNLFLSESKIQSLGNLKSVGGVLRLKHTEIISFENLEYVRNLDLRNTPLSKLYTEEQIRKMVEVEGGVYL